LARIATELQELAPTALLPGSDVERASRYVARLFQDAQLRGDLRALGAVADALQRAYAVVGPWPDLCLIEARLASARHRVDQVLPALQRSPGVAAARPGIALIADRDLQIGRYGDAEAGYRRLLADAPGWEDLARYAHFRRLFGHAEEAERLYVQAQDTLTAKEMRPFAWLELQRGLLDLVQTRYDAAAEHYRIADQAYPGYWLVDEHRAELLGAQGRYAEAETLYLQLIASLRRPELHQALGEMYLFWQKPDCAADCFTAARDAYLVSAEAGECHYWHHLTACYSDLCIDAAQAVLWAGRDHDLRPNFAAQIALAWAMHRSGATVQALPYLEQALASGVQDGHLLDTAARLAVAAGDRARGRELWQRSQTLAPHLRDFHVHR